MRHDQRLLLAEALLLPLLISPAFRLIGVSRTQAWLRRWTRVRVHGYHLPNDPQCTILLARRSQRIVKRILGVGGTCLVRSMTLWTLLLRRGVDTKLRVGIRKINDQVEAHAWLELDGIPANETAGGVLSYEPYPKAIAFDDWKSIARTTKKKSSRRSPFCS